MSVSPEHRGEQRNRIVRAARKCFVRHGFHATGMAEIASACRMSAGNIYHYFPHKHDIVRAISDEARTRLFPLLRPLADHADPVEGLIQIMRLSVAEIAAGSNARLWLDISAEAPRNPIIRKICQHFDREFREILEHLMRHAVKAGQLPAETDLEATSLWLVALLDGATARLAAEPKLDLQRIQHSLAQAVRRAFHPIRA